MTSLPLSSLSNKKFLPQVQTLYQCTFFGVRLNVRSYFSSLSVVIQSVQSGIDKKIIIYAQLTTHTLENSERDGNTRPPDLTLEKPIWRSGSNS